MKSFIRLVPLLMLVALPADSATIRENEIAILPPILLGCAAAKEARIFSYPKVTYHVLSIYSVHYVTNATASVIAGSVHAQSKLGWETDAIKVGHSQSLGLSAAKVHMDTEFYTERCIANGIIELEFTRHNEADC